MTRRHLQRSATRAAALDHALVVMTEQGVGALTVSEVARRLRMRPPSLYKYFPSLHALYDALFARGVQEFAAATAAALAEHPPGTARLLAGGRAYLRGAVGNPAMAQLLHWRVVPGFEPSPDTLALAEQAQEVLREELRSAVAAGELAAEADSDEGARLWTVLLSGLMTQQMANEPGASFEEGHYTGLADEVLDLFRLRYAPTPARTDGAGTSTGGRG